MILVLRENNLALKTVPYENLTLCKQDNCDSLFKDLDLVISDFHTASVLH